MNEEERSRQVQYYDRLKKRGIIRRTYYGTVADHGKLKALADRLKAEPLAEEINVVMSKESKCRIVKIGDVRNGKGYGWEFDCSSTPDAAGTQVFENGEALYGGYTFAELVNIKKEAQRE